MKTLICTTPNRGGLNELKKGQTYQYIGVQEGIFSNSPYVTAKELESEKKFTCHFYRFYDDIPFLKNELEELRKLNNA